MIKQIGLAAVAFTALVSLTAPAQADPPWARHNRWEHRHYEQRAWRHREWRREHEYRRYGYYQPAPPPPPGIYIPFR